jgi:hypothetical protein
MILMAYYFFFRMTVIRFDAFEKVHGTEELARCPLRGACHLGRGRSEIAEETN